MSRWKVLCLFIFFALSFGFYIGLYHFVQSSMHDVRFPLPFSALLHLNRSDPSNEPISSQEPSAPTASLIPSPPIPVENQSNGTEPDTSAPPTFAPTPPTLAPTLAPTPPTPAPTPPTFAPSAAPTEFPFASSRYTNLPHFVNFSHRTDLLFDDTQSRDRTILVYDVQWVPTVAAIILIVSDRIVPQSRVSIGMLRSID